MKSIEQGFKESGNEFKQFKWRKTFGKDLFEKCCEKK